MITYIVVNKRKNIGKRGSILYAMRKRFRWTALLMAFVMIIAVGCQSVGSVDLNRVLMSNFDFQSMEGKYTMELELMMDDMTAAMLGFEAEELDLLRKVRLELHELKQENPFTASAAGSLHIAGTEIPFEMYVSSSQIVVSVDGIRRPIMMDDAVTNPMIAELLEMMSISYEEYQENYLQAMKAFAGYVVPNLPNPDTIGFSRELISINGENVFTTHVHSVIHGDELIPFVQKLLKQLAEDEEGLREALEVIYDLMVPFVERAIEKLQEDMGMIDNESAAVIRLLESYLHNKTLVVEFLATTITYGLTEAMNQLDATEEQVNGLREQGFHLLNDSSYLAFDLYVEDFEKLRRFDFEIFLQPTTEMPLPVNAGIRLYASQEYWNINDKPVKADVIDTSDAIVLDESFHETIILSEIDPESALGQLLIAHGLNKRQFTVILEEPAAESETGESEFLDWYGGWYGKAPFIQDGRAMVSAYWLADKLGLEWDLDWDEEDNEIIFYTDPVTGRTLTVTGGSSIAVLDGEEVQMDTAAVERGYTLYVPLRFVAESFGAEVTYDAETRTITVTRQLF